MEKRGTDRAGTPLCIWFERNASVLVLDFELEFLVALRAFDAALGKDAVIDEHDVAAGRALDFVSVLFRLGFTLDDFFDGLVDDGLFFRPCDRSGSGSFRGLGLGDDFVRSGENGIVIEFFFLDRRFLLLLQEFHLRLR